MLSSLFSVVMFVILLSTLVIIHELGHYLAAKLVGVKVNEFGIGFPPRAKTLFKKWGTKFSLNWIPFGGFVRLEGEIEPDEGEQQVKPNKRSSKNVPFYALPAGKKIIVVLAGVVVNLVFGIVVFAVAFSVMGIPTLYDSARIGQVVSGSPADLAGISANRDLTGIVIAGEEHKITSYSEAIELIKAQQGETITVITSGPCQETDCQPTLEKFEVYVRNADEIDNPQVEGAIGVDFSIGYRKFYPWYEMPWRGAIAGILESLGIMIATVWAFGQMLIDIFTRAQLSADVMGPVGIVHQADQMGLFSQGLLEILHFAGLISVSLAVMNILPIPVLDGGKLVFIILEQLFGRDRIRTFEAYANAGGFAILVFLMLLITGRDILRLVGFSI